MAETNGRSYGVLVIDMQDHYLSQLWWWESRKIKKSQRSVLELCVEEDIPVVEITVPGEPTTKDILYILNEVPRIRPLQKMREDGFTNKELERQLRYWSISHLCVMGIFSSKCVKCTSESAIRLGFRISTSQDVIGSREEDHSWYIENTLYFRRSKDLITHMRHSQ